MKNRLSLCLSVVVASTIGFQARTLYAQIAFGYSTVEWSTASAEVVVVARVADLAFKEESGDGGIGRQWVTATLKVDQVLKGKPVEPIVLVYDTPANDDTWVRWKKSGRKIVWFLGKQDKNEPRDNDFPALPLSAYRMEKVERIVLSAPQNGRAAAAPRADAAAHQNAARSSADAQCVLSMDLHVLDTDDAILAAVKAQVARRDKEPARELNLSVAKCVAARCGPTGDGVGAYLPIDDHLDELARGWLQSNERWRQRAGVEALSETKCDANADALKRFVNDTTSEILIRQLARETLQRWGIECPKPPPTQKLRAYQFEW